MTLPKIAILTAHSSRLYTESSFICLESGLLVANKSGGGGYL